MEHEPSGPQKWDVEADVIVVGFGAAGVAASVTAHDLGAEVVILEKAPEGQEGGNTRVAGQGYLNASSAEEAAAYLTALCGPYTVPEAMVKVWAEEMCRNNAWLESLGGDPQEHQHPPIGDRIPGSARLGLRAQIPRWPDLRLFLHLETVREPSQAASDPRSLSDAGKGTDPARHH
jgi:choline dehydrogenase-like flavoprotein